MSSRRQQRLQRQYGRVGETDPTSPESLRQKSRAELLERISTKLQAGLWVAAACLVLSYARGWESLTDTAGERGRGVGWALSLAWALLGVVFAMGFYLVVWLRRVERVDLPWSTYVPWAIPVASASGVGAFVLFTVGLWPSYGLVTPAVVGVLALGLIMSAHFLPSC